MLVCIGGASMATCVNLTDRGFNPVSRVRRLELLPLDYVSGTVITLK